MNEIIQAFGLSFDPWDESSYNFILSNIRCKSHQIILEGIAYE